MCANKINSPSEPFTTSFLLPLNSQEEDPAKIWGSFLPVMDLPWVLGGSDAGVPAVQTCTESESDYAVQ